MNDAATVNVRVVRRFAAPPEHVFDAWLTPRLLGQWMFGPAVREEKILRLDIDPRVGGTFSMLVERQGETIDHLGTYLEIDRPHRLVFTWGIHGVSDPDDSRVAIDIAPMEEGCELTLIHSLHPDWAEYAQRTEHGWNTMLDVLQRLFAKTQETYPMNDSYGTLVASGTLRLQRSLPGPIDRIWAYLTESDKRGEWLATGDMDLRVGGQVGLFFRHADLSPQQAPTPERYREMEAGHAMSGRITACEPPRLLSYTWGESDGSESEVRFDLAEQNERVLLTVTHSRLRNRDDLVSVAGGWHAHLQILADRLEGREPSNFWTIHEGLEAEYERRLPVA